MSQPTPAPALKAPADWAKAKKTGQLHLAVATRIGRWIKGRVVTEAQFDAAVKAARDTRLR